MIAYDNFKKSLKNLEIRNQFRKDNTSYEDEQIKESIQESVIQRFETCYDCLCKILKRYMEGELGIADVPTAPKPLFRLAYKNDLFSSSLEQWFSYIDTRINTIHDYDGEKAKIALDVIDDFIDDAIGLYQTMANKTWE